MDVEALDRQRDQRLATARNQHRTPGAEFSQPAADANPFATAEKNGSGVAPAVCPAITHTPRSPLLPRQLPSKIQRFRSTRCPQRKQGTIRPTPDVVISS